MIAIVFAAAVVMAQAAPAADAANGPSAAPPAAKTPKDLSGVTVQGESLKKRAPPDPKEVVCHKETVIGSMFPKTVCAQRQEFAQRTREDQKDLRDSLLYNPLKSN